MERTLIGQIVQATDRTIRTAVSGVAIIGILWLAFPESISTVKDELGDGLSAIAVFMFGHIAYSIYRIPAWVLIDHILFTQAVEQIEGFDTAPSALLKSQRISAGKDPNTSPTIEDKAWALATFCQLRFGDHNRFPSVPMQDERLSGYFYMRWAVLHFGMMTSIALMAVSAFHAECSIPDKNPLAFLLAGLGLMLLSGYEMRLLFLTEAELFRKPRRWTWSRTHGFEPETHINLHQTPEDK